MRRAPSGRRRLFPPRGVRRLFIWPLLFPALLVAHPAFSAPDLFDGFRPLVGTDPDSILLTDLNADGKPDIVVGNCGSHDVSVLLGRGGGAFDPEARYPAGACPGQIVTLDFTSDGKVDLAFVAMGSIVVLDGDGAGGLAQPAFGGVAGAAGGSLGGDFDSDGNKDLVSAGGTPANLVVFLGNGDGTFQTGIPYSTTGASFVGADFNGDGRVDVATSDYDSVAQSVTISVHLGNPDGSFTLSDSIVVTTSQFFLIPRVVAGKFSGDAQTDLMVTDLLETQLLAGLGDGTFVDPVPVALDTTGPVVLAGDFDADGKDDLMMGGLHTVDLFRQGNNGAFEAYGSHPVGFSWSQLALGDLDGDGDRDLAVLNDESEDISLLLAPSFSSPGPGFHHPTPPGVWALETTDLQRDGKPDLLAVSSDNFGLFEEFLGTGAGAFSSLEVAAPIFGATGLAAADMNGDGHPDLVFNGLSDMTELLGKGDGSYESSAITFPPGDTRGPVLAADFNEDGHQELIVRNDVLLMILQGKGDGNFDLPTFIAGDMYPDALASGYLNGDTHRDLVVASVDGVSVFLGGGDLSFTQLPSLSLPSMPFGVAVADLDQDSHVDIVAALDDGRVAVLKNDGVGAFTTTFFPAGGELTGVVVADFDADDILDVAVADSRGHALEILRGKGDATFENPLRYQAGLTPASLVAADFDVDGRMDVALSNGSVEPNFGDFAEIVIYLNHGPYPVCHDGDGDGFGLPGSSVCSGGSSPDCDDASSAVFPGHAEACDALDNDCDGMTDEGFPDGDGDVAADCADDCSLIWNPDQADLDADGVGDACEESALFSNANLSSAGFSAGRVDGRDLEIFAGAFGTCPGDADFTAAANLDRIPETVGPPGSCVSLSDFHLFMEAFAQVH
jgi:putative metal-binding protein/VCBS repeat protein